VTSPIAIGLALLVGGGLGAGVGSTLDTDGPSRRVPGFGVALGTGGGPQGVGPLGAARSSRSTAACKRSRRPVLVDQEGRVFRHALYAIRLGHPQLLHKGRPGTSDRNRDAWERKQGKRFPTRRGFDRDEYPPAMSVEGGADTHLRYVPSAENQAQGRELGKQTRAYCPGQAFLYIDLPDQ
jgi:hypothetical protein